eukprot:COSAG06_NODE_6274_length_3002_cov_9.345849_2_plen_32_part_00
MGQDTLVVPVQQFLAARGLGALAMPRLLLVR